RQHRQPPAVDARDRAARRAPFRMMGDVVYLIDVDNTLVDNDAIIEDLRHHLVEAFGAESGQRYWEIFEELRTELGYADYLGALQRYRVERPRDSNVLE